MTPEEKKELVKKYFAAKAKEDKAKKERKEIEEIFQSEYAPEVPEGQKSKTFEEDTFKIVCKKADKTLVLDEKMYLLIRQNIPAEQRPEKVKFSLDVEGYEWLKKNNYEAYRTVSECVSEKDTAPSITITKK
jgi:hypothetical protein